LHVTSPVVEAAKLRSRSSRRRGGQRRDAQVT
jgi:hypothetical protein